MGNKGESQIVKKATKEVTLPCSCRKSYPVPSGKVRCYG